MPKLDKSLLMGLWKNWFFDKKAILLHDLYCALLTRKWSMKLLFANMRRYLANILDLCQFRYMEVCPNLELLRFPSHDHVTRLILPRQQHKNEEGICFSVYKIISRQWLVSICQKFEPKDTLSSSFQKYLRSLHFSKLSPQSYAIMDRHCYCRMKEHGHSRAFHQLNDRCTRECIHVSRTAMLPMHLEVEVEEQQQLLLLLVWPPTEKCRLEEME